MKLILYVIRQRPRTFGLIGLLILADLLLYGYLLLSQQPSLTELQTKWMENRRLVASGETRTPAVILRDGTADLAKFREIIPAKKEYTRIVGDIMETVANNGLSTGGLSYRPTQVKNEQLMAYVISMDVTGKYAAIKSFIADIEQLPELITIDSMSLNGGSLIEETVSMKLQLTAYLKTEGT